MTRLPKLPIGIQTFEIIRTEGYLYVDKTRYLVDLIDSGRIYFLSRPRRFGKSLTISTFDALFSGKKELFQGLAAEEFLNRPGYRPHPVIRLDMSRITTGMGIDMIRSSILERVRDNARRLDVAVKPSDSPAEEFDHLLIGAEEKYSARVVLLIDEYDKPVLDHVHDPAMADEVRKVLRDVYARIKAADEHLRFVFMTGITKFAKMGVFSVLNHLTDISMNPSYATMLGYTESELADNFGGYLDKTADALGEDRDALLERIRDYYDGFSFDGKNRLYNPFSTLNFFFNPEFNNYWFETGTPSYLAEYVKRHDLEMESFRGIEVFNDFTSTAEIENTSPESFLYQSGYLSVREKRGMNLILDYPNKEVLSAVANLFLYGKMGAAGFGAETNNLEMALADGDAQELVKIYNRLLATIPYDVYSREERKYKREKDAQGKTYALLESFYHALLFTLLWGARLDPAAESHSYKGRSDIEVEKGGWRYVVELKVAEGREKSEEAAAGAMRQMRDKGYADKYAGMAGIKGVMLVALAVDKVERRIGASKIERL